MNGNPKYNNDAAWRPAEKFLAFAKKQPEAHAMHCGGIYYSYAELMSLAVSIYSVIPCDCRRAAIIADGSIYSYASLIALSLSGAAAVPLNPGFPATKNQDCLSIAEVDTMLYSGNDAGLAHSRMIRTDLAEEGILNDPVRILNQGISYVIFTSGTTGTPKAVPVEHHSLAHFFDFFLREYDFNTNDRFLQTYELTFDVSVFSFWMPLITGGCCYILPAGIRYIMIMKMLSEFKITVVSMVPSVLRYLRNYLHEMRFSALRYSFFSGDALPVNDAVAWSGCLPAGEIHNFYGPTETTIVCSRHIFNVTEVSSANGIVPIGRPFPGMDMLISEDGELCIAGPQVISHYLGKEDPGKFFIHEGKQFYRTGDMAGKASNGEFLFFGRKDRQVKLNGYRIELEEITAVISEITGADSEVILHRDRLVAFTTSGQSTALLIEKLGQRLPPYMIPAEIIHLKEIPLNSNGKNDLVLLTKMTGTYA